MKIQTFSILVGSSACNACCPYCVSEMTPNAMPSAPQEVNWDRFRVATKLADRAGATTAMITGKGEPTLFPDLVTQHIEALPDWWPLIELQTNGIRIAQGGMSDHLHKWSRCGLTTVALSVAHWDEMFNKTIYGQSYSISGVVDELHEFGFSVRLCCSMLKGYVDSVDAVETMIQFARTISVEQLTFTPINAPASSARKDVQKFVDEHRLPANVMMDVRAFLDDRRWSLLLELPHGARVYDVFGQNVCLNNCLTGTADKSVLRNLIFHPDGAIRFDWEHEGSRIL